MAGLFYALAAIVGLIGGLGLLIGQAVTGFAGVIAAAFLLAIGYMCAQLAAIAKSSRASAGAQHAALAVWATVRPDAIKAMADPAPCPRCGNIVAPDVEFCPPCGVRVRTGVEVQRNRAAMAALSSIDREVST